MVTTVGRVWITVRRIGRSYPEFGFLFFSPRKCGRNRLLRGLVDRYEKHKPYPSDNEDRGPSRLRGVWVGACAADSLGAGHRPGALAPLAPLPGVRVELRCRPRRA